MKRIRRMFRIHSANPPPIRQISVLSLTSLQKDLFHRKEHKDHKEIEWKSLCSLRSLWLIPAFCSGVISESL